MAMAPFGSFFPGTAVPTRSVTLTRPCLSLAPGTYDFVELYCDEVGCSCENVLINVVDGKQRHLAPISHSLRPGGVFGNSRAPRTFLDPMNPQSDLALDLLALVEQVLCTPDYEARLRRHRAMVREKVDGAAPQTRSAARGAR